MSLDELIIKALEEDLGDGDHTSMATIPAETKGKAHLLIKEEGILAGVEIAGKVFSSIDKHLIFNVLIPDGSKVMPGDIAFILSGRSRSILSGERVALNFMQRMSGIATTTRKMVNQLHGLPTKILDTRKTTPLLRELEKRAVRIGGGENHRMGLYDMIMIKDNHVDYAGGIGKAIQATHNYLNSINLILKIEIEVRNFDELRQVLATGGIDRIMLDNFGIKDLKKAVDMINGKFETEASGGININNIRQYAETGVNYISVGALTHHISSLDMSLKAVNE